MYIYTYVMLCGDRFLELKSCGIKHSTSVVLKKADGAKIIIVGGTSWIPKEIKLDS